MKHMKKPEPRPRPSERPPRRSRPPRAPVGRDRAFRAALAKEYGVTEVPKSLQRRTEQTLQSLPDTLPKRPRPVLRVFKGAVSAAAVMAASFAILMGLNVSNPRFTEALPGLGPVFAAMNAPRVTPSPSASPAPSPTPEPRFLPVTALNKGDFSGMLIIDDAWTDGNVLTLDMSVSTDSEFDKKLGAESIDDYDYLFLAPRAETDGSEPFSTGYLTVSADSDYRDFAFDDLIFTRDDSGKFTARWQVYLDGLEVSDSLKLGLEMPDMSANYSIGGSEGAYYSFAGFSADFTLAVDSSQNRSISVQAADGPVTLRSVDYAPGRVELDVSLPYLGKAGDLYPDSSAFEYPLGCFAALTCMDGQYEYTLDTITPYPEEYQDAYPGSTVLDMSYVFRAPDSAGELWPRELKGPLTLTLYEFPQYDGPVGRVMAEFTIDLSTGRAYPSANYEKAGFEKADPTLTTQQRFENAMTNGLLLPPDSLGSAMTGTGYGPFAQFTLYSDMSYSGRELSVYCYLGDNLEHSFTFVIGGDYEDSEGSYSTSVYTLPGSGQEYLNTPVLIRLPDWLIYGEDDYTPFDRLELIDPISGEVLIPDLYESWRASTRELLGRDPTAEASAIETDGTASQG